MASPRKRPKVLAVKFKDGGTIQVRDLSVDTITEIARRNSTSWAVVVDNATLDLGIARDVVEAAAEALKVPAPKFDTGRDAIAVLGSCFELVDDDVPVMPDVESELINPTSAS